MKLYEVYPLFDVEPVRAEGLYLWDKDGTKFTDLYGGHAVISIGHSHPHYVEMITSQLRGIGFYSNSVQISAQKRLASKIGTLSGYDDYQLFLCNSGTEAVENALKIAGFEAKNHSGKNKIIAFERGFHGRTSIAVQLTDNPKIRTVYDEHKQVVRLPLGDVAAFEQAYDDTISAVVIEGIQGVGGIHTPSSEFLHTIRDYTQRHDALMIVDEIQSGYGRSGKFFAHQYADVRPDIITIAKGMGNGFPVGGVLVAPHIKPMMGQLGTTFGGNHLACAAAEAVVDVLSEEKLIPHAATIGKKWMDSLRSLPHVKEVRGSGLMIGIELDMPIRETRLKLLNEYKIFTGVSSDPTVIRLLPPMCIGQEDIDYFNSCFKRILS